MASVHACEDIMRTYPLDLLVDVEAVEVASDCGSFSRDIAPKVNLLEELVSAPDQKKKKKKCRYYWRAYSHTRMNAFTCRCFRGFQYCASNFFVRLCCVTPEYLSALAGGWRRR